MLFRSAESGVPTACEILPSEVLFEGDSEPMSTLKFGKDTLIEVQSTDSSLSNCGATAVTEQEMSEHEVTYFYQNGVLMRKWTPKHLKQLQWSATYQLVVPTTYRKQILSLAHDHVSSGHLGVWKTYNRISFGQV